MIVAPASEVIVYVPAPEHAGCDGIARGSGIVGRPRGEEVLIYFEGAIHRQVGMERLADRVNHAYGRMHIGYPTVAFRVVPRDALVVVGTFDARTGQILLTGPLAERAVAEWIGASVLDPAELVSSARGRG